MSENKIFSRFLYMRLLQFVKPYWHWSVLAVLASLLVVGSDVFMAKLVQPLVDEVIIEKRHDLVIYIPWIVFLVAIVKGLGRYGQTFFVTIAGESAIQDVRKLLFNHITQLSYRVHSLTKPGDLMSVVLNNVSQMQSVVSNVLVDILRETFALVGLTVVVFTTDLKLALVAFIVIPLTVLPALEIGKRIKRNSRRSQEAMGSLTSVLQEALSGIKVVKAYGSEDVERSKFIRANRDYFHFVRKVVKYSALTAPINEVVASLGAGGVLWYGINRVLLGEMTQGELLSFFTAMLMMYTPLKRVLRANNKIQQAMGAAERVFGVLDTNPEIVDRADAIEVSDIKGAITFEHVSFGYDDVPVIQDVNLAIAPGELVAFVGPSGAGKSTLVNLVCRFFDPKEGRILIDGHDISRITQKSLKDSLAIVDQEGFLFNASIAENIAYAQEQASVADICQAAKQAYADEFIDPMPDGYQTFVGTRGVRLSGGQKQRICIARAILRNAPILVLDEATSALDTESEAIVQKALANLMADRTTLVIAHRLSTIQRADRIVVMDKGRIVEVGNHEALLKNDGLYRRLYDMQFRDLGA